MPFTAVFFDLVGTLARFVPEQEQLLVDAAATQGITLSLDQARRGFAAAGEWWNRVVGLRYRTSTQVQRDALNLEYDRRLFEGAGVPTPDDTLSKVFRELFRHGGPSRLALYDDAEPALSWLSARGLRLGVISNMGRDLPHVLEELRVAAYMEAALSSGEVGVSKPDPRIFLEAAARLSVLPAATLYVGDLYDSDVMGARGAGMEAVLVDRYGLFGHHQDCLRISGLNELPDMLEGHALAR